MTTTNDSVEKLVREFGNKLAMQLNPSNDTMQAIRLLRKELPDFLTTFKDQCVREALEAKAVEVEKLRRDTDGGALEDWAEDLSYNVALDDVLALIRKP